METHWGLGEHIGNPMGTCFVFSGFLPWSFANELTIYDLLLKDGKMLNKKMQERKKFWNLLPFINNYPD